MNKVNEMRRMAAAIITEAGNNAALIEKASKLLAMIEAEAENSAPAKVIACVAMTTADGERHYQPIVGNAMIPTCREDFKMLIFDDIVEAQERCTSMNAMLRCRGFNMVFMPVTSEQLDALQTKLDELVNEVFEAVEASVTSLNGLGLGNTAVEASQILQLIFANTMVAKTGLTQDGAIIERPEEGYQEEQTYDDCDDEDDGCDDEDDDDDECSGGCCNCGFCW